MGLSSNNTILLLTLLYLLFVDIGRHKLSYIRVTTKVWSYWECLYLGRWTTAYVRMDWKEYHDMGRAEAITNLEPWVVFNRELSWNWFYGCTITYRSKDHNGGGVWCHVHIGTLNSVGTQLHDREYILLTSSSVCNWHPHNCKYNRDENLEKKSRHSTTTTNHRPPTTNASLVTTLSLQLIIQ